MAGSASTATRARMPITRSISLLLLLTACRSPDTSDCRADGLKNLLPLSDDYVHAGHRSQQPLQRRTAEPAEIPRAARAADDHVRDAVLADEIGDRRREVRAFKLQRDAAELLGQSQGVGDL